MWLHCASVHFIILQHAFASSQCLSLIHLSSFCFDYKVLTYYSMLLSWTLRTLCESGLDSAPWGAEEVDGSSATGYFIDKIVGMETLGDSLRPTRLIGVNVGYSALTFSIIFLCSAFGKFFYLSNRCIYNYNKLKDNHSKVRLFSCAINRS